MSRKLIGVLSASAMMWALIGPAGAQTIVPRFKTERTYVHCGSTKSAQIDFLNESKIPTWDTTPPGQGVQAGAGCGSLEVPGVGWLSNQDTQPVFDLVWEGSFIGNLDTLTVHPNAIWAGPGKAIALAGLSVELTIDGQAIALPLDDQGVQAVEPLIVDSDTGASSDLVFSIDDIGFIEPPTDADNDGFGDDTGTVPHTIRLTLNAYYVDAHQIMVWVWDTTEVPSGIEFNPATLTGPVLSRVS